MTPTYPVLPKSQIEIIQPNIQCGNIRHALFDFDGTIAQIREGWQAVMQPMMVKILIQTPRNEEQDQTEALVKDFVTRLTGKQTVYQMIQLAEEIEKRGVQAKQAFYHIAFLLICIFNEGGVFRNSFIRYLFPIPVRDLIA